MNQEQEQNVEQMTPLDQMIAQDQLQMLKAAIPYASFGLQPSLAILSKWLELQRTIQLFSRPADLSMMSVDAPHVSPLEMLQDISRFAAGPQRDLLSQMFQTMQMVQMRKIPGGNDAVSFLPDAGKSGRRTVFRLRGGPDHLCHQSRKIQTGSGKN